MPRGISRLDEARLQGRLWTPAALRPSAWFDAADLSTISVATGVSEWRDKSGNSKHLVQATTASQPSIEVDTASGLSVLRFDGSNDFMSCTTWSDTITSQSSFALFNVNAHNTYYGRVYTQAAAGVADTAYVNCLQWASFPTYGSYTGGSSVVAEITLATATWNLWSNVHDGQSITNRTSDATASGSVPTLNLSLATLRVGDEINTNNTPSFNGLFAELVICNNYTASSRDTEMMQGYMAHKWALTGRLPASHPFRNRPPLIGD